MNLKKALFVTLLFLNQIALAAAAGGLNLQMLNQQQAQTWPSMAMPQPQMRHPTQWPLMMSRPMQQFGQSPQMRFGQIPQMRHGGFLGQQQSLNVPSHTGGTNGFGLSPQIQNQSRIPAGAPSLMPPQQPQQFVPGQGQTGLTR